MKKLKTLLTVLFVSICAVQNAWARVAPTIPEGKTLESGQSYYLYNVIEGKFACRSTTNTSYAALGTYGDKVTITATSNEGEYTIQWANNNYYWRGFDSYIESSNGTSNYNYFYIAESSMGYTIQRSSRNTSYYKADEYVGYNGNNGDRLNPALAEGSIHWRLMSVDEAEYYMAKHKLFTYLEVADQYNFYITQYELVYNNPDATTADLDLAQATLGNALDMSSNYVSPNWTEYPILFQNNTNNKWELNYNNSSLYWSVNKNNNSALETSSTLTGTVNVDNDATLCYSYYGYGYASLQVYLDGELVEIIKDNTSKYNERRYYIELSPGKHDIAWTCIVNNASTQIGSYYYYLEGIGIQNTPTLTPATTTVEGQLGTEVLKVIDPVSDVRKIVINGVIGADDWTTIGLMVNAFSIDMSGATATAPMPASIFTGSKFAFLHDVKLPQGLTAIGERAFYQSDVENEMDFPESLTSIGYRAFGESKLKAAYMKDGITSIGIYAFEDCYFLENATYPSTASSVPDRCFEDCYNLRTFEIPEGISTIAEYAFRNCSQFNARFPSTMKTVKTYAFYNTATDSLFVSENMTVYSRAFGDCSNLVYAEWPTSFVHADGDTGSNNTSRIVQNCPKLNKVKLMSPTVVTYDYQSFFYENTLGNITLLVPDFLESAYKLDPYWYQCNVQGFNSAEITDWIVTQSMVLNPGQRIGGTPNIDMQQQSTLTINGDTPQAIGNLDICRDWYINSWNTMILSNTNKVTIDGELTYRAYTPEKRWAFFCLPFDTKVSDITSESSFAIRYYDGANRATNGNSGSWKNYSSEDIIPAGTGFILQTSQQCSTFFTAQDNATKQYVVSNNEFVKALAANDSEVAANKGWNLVGNPWLTYYNIHKLNFTAPITVWNGDQYNPKYVAYSIIDDDYAIKPLEAFFVQCPDEINSISFPIDGRQLTDVIESQNGARRFGESTRKLVDIELTNGEQSDKTRFVLNPKAKMDYETTCDASKFFSMESGVAQIYTIQNGVQMAINERPAGDGVVTIGMKIPADGTYTIKSERTALKEAVIVDKLNGTETTLSAEGYTFSAHAGTIDNRFELHLSASETTGIKELKDSSIEELKSFYNLNGQRMSAPQKGINIVNGKKVIIK